jgi:hypothetical protein
VVLRQLKRFLTRCLVLGQYLLLKNILKVASGCKRSKTSLENPLLALNNLLEF